MVVVQDPLAVAVAMTAVGRELPFTFLVVWALESLHTDRRLSAMKSHSA
jgi:hypothetical protein